jgi:hypothetical protein
VKPLLLSNESNSLSVTLAYRRLKSGVLIFVAAETHLHRLAIVIGHNSINRVVDRLVAQFRDQVNGHFSAGRQTGDYFDIERSLILVTVRRPNHGAIYRFPDDRSSDV